MYYYSFFIVHLYCVKVATRHSTDYEYYTFIYTYMYYVMYIRSVRLQVTTKRVQRKFAQVFMNSRLLYTLALINNANSYYTDLGKVY